MAPWGDARLFLCILCITCCCSVIVAQVPMDCCLRVLNKTIERHIVADYKQQIRGEGCDIAATVFVSRRGRTLCVPPNEEWVKDLMKHVDDLKEKCKKLKYKGRRCVGVKPQ
ncbi:C-C motif chemokine 19-like [Stegastes partitus]|uniref:C-C motif chemokine 19-like n=1 Tax=Stegastes partitus TaxID=144197 RepID=A0A3B4ZG31_9TELE|nr:PREDICTED: C-C motif chemokine 19-like [Stegastes partitus]